MNATGHREGAGRRSRAGRARASRLPTPADAGSENRNLRSAGLKITAPRRRVLQALEQNDGARHFSAEQIYRKLLDSGEDISIATVYRVLTQFERAGLVTRHNFEEKHAVYELTDSEHHDHMVCVETGEVTEFCDIDIERLQQEIARHHGYELVDHSLVLYVRPAAGKEPDSSGR